VRACDNPGTAGAGPIGGPSDARSCRPGALRAGCATPITGWTRAGPKVFTARSGVTGRAFRMGRLSVGTLPAGSCFRRGDGRSPPAGVRLRIPRAWSRQLQAQLRDPRVLGLSCDTVAKSCRYWGHHTICSKSYANNHSNDDCLSSALWKMFLQWKSSKKSGVTKILRKRPFVKAYEIPAFFAYARF
jgi:hypothetical protein